MKEELIEYLKTQRNFIKEGCDIFYSAKEYYRSKGINIGGSCSSNTTHAGITYRDENDEIQRFRVSLEEIQ